MNVLSNTRIRTNLDHLQGLETKNLIIRILLYIRRGQRLESEERGLKISTMADIESAALIPPSEPEAEAVKSHKLERKWTFWYDNQSRPKAGAAWGSNLKKAYTFDTVEEFWWYEILIQFNIVQIPLHTFTENRILVIRLLLYIILLCSPKILRSIFFFL